MSSDDESSQKGLPVARFSPLGVSRDTRGTIAAMPFWAGQGVGAVKRAEPARDIVRELVQEAEQLLRKW